MVKSCDASNGKQSDNFVQKSRKHHRRLNDKRGDFIGHGETFFRMWLKELEQLVEIRHG